MYAARQRFQNGQMIWREDQKRIYVLYNDGRWEGYADKWVEGDPADDPALIPPEGLQQPVRGFGKLWREGLGGVSAAIGWAQEEEKGLTAQFQDWDHGAVLRFGGEDIVLLDGGAWRWTRSRDLTRRTLCILSEAAHRFALRRRRMLFAADGGTDATQTALLRRRGVHSK